MSVHANWIAQQPIEGSTRVKYTEASGITPREQTFNIEGELTPDSITNGTSIEEVDIGSAVTTIGNGAFSGCRGLTSVTIPESVTEIGDYAFRNCTGLTSVAIGNGVSSIGREAFLRCNGLTSVTIPNSVTSIGADAFYDCDGLTSVTIGNGVTFLVSAFFSCSNLTSVIFEGDEPTAGADVFAYVASGCKAYVDGTLPGWSQHPDGSKWNGLVIEYKEPAQATTRVKYTIESGITPRE